MTEVKKIAGNTLVLFFAKVIMLLVSAVLMVVLARYLGPYHYGNFKTAFSACALIAILIELGMDKIAVRDCASHLEDNRHYLGNVLTLKLFFSAGSVFLTVTLVKSFGYRYETAHLIYIGLGVFIINSLANSYQIPFRSYEKMGYEALIKVAKSLFLMFLIFLAVYLKQSVITIALFYLVTAVFNLGLGTIIVKTDFFRPGFNFEPRLSRHLMKSGFILALAILFNSYHDVVRIVTHRVLGSQAAGYYSAGASLYQALELLVPLSLITALFPLISRLHGGDKRNLAEVYLRGGKYLYLISLPLAVIFLTLADQIVILFFGPAYLSSAGVVRVLGVVVLLMLQNYLLFDMMVAVRKEKTFALIMGGSALINLGFAICLTRLHGINGGAAAVGLAQFFSLAVFMVVLQRDYRVFSLLRSTGRPLISAVLMGGLILWEKYLNFPLGVILISGTLLYGLALFPLRVFDREDGILWRELFSRPGDGL